MFSAEQGEECILYMQDFTINTDHSIMPYSDLRKDHGAFADPFLYKSKFQITDDFPIYCTMEIYMSSLSKVIDRSFQKVDSLLSYIGGLVGTVALFLFLLSTYNSYSY